MITKNLLTNPELIDELENYSAQITAFALQMEKLTRFKSEAKISDAIYFELYDDICKKIGLARRERHNQTEAACVRVNEIGAEREELKYRLERLEVRRMLDFVSAEKYSATKEELLKRVGENDEIMLLIAKLIASMDEAFGKIDAFMPEAQEVVVQPSFGMLDCEPQQAIVQPMAVQGLEARQTVVQSIVMPPVPPKQATEDVRVPKPIQESSNKTDCPQELDIETMAQQEPLSDESICPRCQTGNPSDGVFCFACGTKLGSHKPSGGKVAPTPMQSETMIDETCDEVQVEPVIRTTVKRKEKRGTERAKAFSDSLAFQKCPKCGMENLSIATYCYQCNSTLSGRGK